MDDLTRKALEMVAEQFDKVNEQFENTSKLLLDMEKRIERLESEEFLATIVNAIMQGMDQRIEDAELRANEGFKDPRTEEHHHLIEQLFKFWDQQLRDHDYEKQREKMRMGTEHSLTTSDVFARIKGRQPGS
jgi:hypothetical protein